MININKLNEQENRFYKSALAFYEGSLLKNNGYLEESINQTLTTFKDYVDDIDNLKKYLIQENPNSEILWEALDEGDNLKVYYDNAMLIYKLFSNVEEFYPSDNIFVIINNGAISIHSRDNRFSIEDIQEFGLALLKERRGLEVCNFKFSLSYSKENNEIIITHEDNKRDVIKLIKTDSEYYALSLGSMLE